MKRIVLAGIGAGAVLAATLGSATALNINDPGVVQFGQSSQLSCDNDGVSIKGYNLETDGISASYGVVVTDIADACSGKTLVATVTNSSGDQLAKGVAIIPDNNDNKNETKVTWDPYTGVSAAKVHTVRLTIG